MTGHRRNGSRVRRLALATLATLVAQPTTLCLAATTDTSTPSQTVQRLESSTLVRALRAELERTAELRMQDAEPPYYVAYGVFDVDQIDLIGEFGGIANDERKRQRFLRVDLRVGSPEFDSGNTRTGGFFAASLPLDDDLLALRRQIWWTTDRAYKSSVEALAAKRADESTTSNQERVPDFAPEPAQQTVEQGDVALPDRAELRDLVRSLSARMRSATHVFEGGVRLRVIRMERTFLSSEGAFGYEPSLWIQWAVIARTQADDGMNLVHYDGGVVRDMDRFPSRAELEGRVDRVLSELAELREAPVSPAYVGPVIFEGDAAPALLRRLVIPHVTGTPPPSGNGMRESEPAAIESGRSSVFARRVGKRVAPTWFSLYDDPTARDDRRDPKGSKRRGEHRDAKTSGSLPWPGTYAFDDEGTRPERVALIEKGRFESFLMSRTPARGFPESNGHGRGGLLSPRAQPGNVFVESKQRKSRKALYARALAEAKAAGEDYAIVIRRIDDPSITQAYRGVDFQPESRDPLLYAVRIRPDGSEEPVRGLALITTNPRSLRDLLATGNEAPAYGYFASDYDAIGGGYWEVFPAYAVGASIHAPSLLFEEMELAPAANLRTSPPSIAAPMERREGLR